MTELIQAARAVRDRAYAPYSQYPVGAAVLAEDGRVFVGCNVENASYGVTTCAERNAVSAMIAGGALRLVAVAVLTRDGGSPCGVCRQVLHEFSGGRDVEVICASEEGTVRRFLLSELLPEAFDLGFR